MKDCISLLKGSSASIEMIPFFPFAVFLFIHVGMQEMINLHILLMCKILLIGSFCLFLFLAGLSLELRTSFLLG
jgi:hypothetical protein